MDRNGMDRKRYKKRREDSKAGIEQTRRRKLEQEINGWIEMSSR